MLQLLRLTWQRTSLSWRIAGEQWRVVGSARPDTGSIRRWFRQLRAEAGGNGGVWFGASWARTLTARGIEVRLLPAQYVRAYVKRNKTDAADARA